MPDEKKDSPDVEYEKEFDKLASGSAPEASKPETPPATEKQGSKEPEAKPEAKAEEPKPEQKKEEQPGNVDPKAELPPPPEASEKESGERKALRDTKAWATKLAQENAELKRTLDKFKDGTATGKEVTAAQKGMEDTKKELASKVKEVYKDYPELKDVLDPLISMADTFSNKLDMMEKHGEEERKRAEMRTFFETEVEPKVLAQHPDFAKIKSDEQFFVWADKQRPSLRTAAMFSLDPDDLIFAVGEYKKFLGTGAAGSVKAEQDLKKEGIRANLSAMSGSGSKPPIGSKSTPSRIDEVDANDYDTAFDVASKLKR